MAPSNSDEFMTTQPSFLTAEWRNLVMLNYEIEPELLTQHVPRGCELDTFSGKTFISVVGFQFLDTRVLGIPVPWHRNFEEVNLRFYVRHKSGEEWRRGVVFIKELVPRWAIAFVARTIYGENYVSLPMRHSIASAGDAGDLAAHYGWHRDGNWEGLRATYSGQPSLALEVSEETFITEHYWGYAKQKAGSTVEYQVEHPRWHVWRAETSSLECDVKSLYGPEFVDSLAGEPSSAFVTVGSEIVVRKGRKL